MRLEEWRLRLLRILRVRVASLAYRYRREYLGQITPKITLLNPDIKDDLALYAIDRLLKQLEHEVQVFRAAIELFVVARANRRHEWGFMAFREGALCIWQFGMALESLSDAINAVPLLKPEIDHSLRRFTFRRFKAAFPNWEKMRNAVAHRAELFATADRVKKDSLKQGVQRGNLLSISKGTPVIIEGMVQADTHEYSTTYRGELISYKLNEPSLVLLSDLTEQYYSAFRKAELKVRAINLAEIGRLRAGNGPPTAAG